MELTVLNRLTLLGLLPPHGDLTMMRLVRDLVGVLSFSQEEHDAIGFWEEGEPPNQRQRWDPDCDLVKDAHISQRMEVYFVDKLRELESDGDGKLTLAQLDLWDLFDVDNFDSPG